MDGDAKKPPRRPLPPPGPSLRFSAWCKVLYQRLRADLPDVHAEGTTREVTLSLPPPGSQWVTITPDAGVWYVRMFRVNRLVMTLAIERHDQFTCRIATASIGAFFSDALATGQQAH